MVSDKYSDDTSRDEGEGCDDGSSRESTDTTDSMSARTSIRERCTESYEDSSYYEYSTTCWAQNESGFWPEISIEDDATDESYEKGVSPESVRLGFWEDAFYYTWYSHDPSESTREYEYSYTDQDTTDEGLSIKWIHRVIW